MTMSQKAPRNYQTQAMYIYWKLLAHSTRHHRLLIQRPRIPTLPSNKPRNNRIPIRSERNILDRLISMAKHNLSSA